MQIPPWLQITPMSYLQAAESGARLGLQRQQLADSERESVNRDQMQRTQMQERQQESAAAAALQRNRLMQIGQQQAGELDLGRMRADNSLFETAVNGALRGQQLDQQAGASSAAQELAQAKLEAQSQRNSDLAAFHDQDLKARENALELRKSTAIDPFDKERMQSGFETLKGISGQISKLGETLVTLDPQVDKDKIVKIGAAQRALSAQREAVKSDLLKLKMKYSPDGTNSVDGVEEFIPPAGLPAKSRFKVLEIQ